MCPVLWLSRDEGNTWPTRAFWSHVPVAVPNSDLAVACTRLKANDKAECDYDGGDCVVTVTSAPTSAPTPAPTLSAPGELNIVTAAGVNNNNKWLASVARNNDQASCGRLSTALQTRVSFVTWALGTIFPYTWDD